MTDRDADIEVILEEIERADVAAHDPSMEPAVREDILRGFVDRTTTPLIELLGELRQWRDRAAAQGTLLPKNSYRVFIEGHSEQSLDLAMADAFEKSRRYFTETNDVSLTLIQLQELPKGGYRATIEVHITPMKLQPHPHVAHLDVESERFHDKDFHAQVRAEAGTKQKLVYDHFAKISGAVPSGFIPDHFMIQVNDANLMNFMIEREFFKVGHKVGSPSAQPDFAPDIAPKQFMVRVKPVPASEPD